jgi:hypothetical protein
MVTLFLSLDGILHNYCILPVNQPHRDGEAPALYINVILRTLYASAVTLSSPCPSKDARSR